MRRRPTIHVVEDAEDSRELVLFVDGLADRGAGRAVMHPTPGLVGRRQLASELLIALGKRFDALRVERAIGRAWELVDIWMAAERVRDLFVLRAQLLPPVVWEGLIELARRARLEMWFMLQGRQSRLATTVSHFQARRWCRAEFVDRWMDAHSAEAPPSPAVSFPEVAAEDFPTFRAACRRLLSEPDFARVDQVFCESMDATTAWLNRRGRLRYRVLTDIPVGDAAVTIQGVLSGSSCPSEALTRLRGSQAAFFLAGWLVTFDPPMFVAPESSLVSLGPGLDPAAASRIRRLCTPRSTAVMALFLAAELDPEAMTGLRIAHVANNGGAVAVESRRRFSIPDHARSLVRAQLLDRQREGATGSDPLFVHPKTRAPDRPSSLRITLRWVGQRTAIGVGNDHFWGARGAEAWLRSRHISISRLDRVPAEAFSR